MPVPAVLAGTGCLLLAACSAGGAASTAGSPAATTAATTAATSTGTAPAAPASTSSQPPVAASASSSAGTPARPSATASAVPQLLLEPDGLGVLVGEASIRHLPFGTSRSAVSSALAATLGPMRPTTLPECGQGPRAQLDRQGFSALFDGTRFVGWTSSGTPGHPLTTADGLGVGSTLAQVRAHLAGVTVRTDSLGPEFTAADGAGLSGLLEGTAPGSRVTTLYAGETCFFR